jgi:hypothetical protein
MSASTIKNLSLAALLVVLTASMASAQTYWFETYETAVDKIEAEQQEQMEEVLELLGALVAERPLPQANLRVPGDRLVDYLPYFQKARVEMMLGKYDDARKSLDASEAFQVVRDNSDAMDKLREMRGALDLRASSKP